MASRLIGSRVRSRAGSAAAGVVVAGVVLAGLGGCYQRTVKARGIGATQMAPNLYEPNVKRGQSPGVIEGFGDLLFGPGVDDR